MHVKSAIPKIVEGRLRSLAKNNDVFDAAVTDYNLALSNSRYKHQFTFDELHAKKDPT